MMNANLANDYIGQIMKAHYIGGGSRDDLDTSKDAVLMRQLSEIGNQMEEEPNLEFEQALANDMDDLDNESGNHKRHRSSIASGDTDTVINQLMSKADFNFLDVLTEMHSRKNSDALLQNQQESQETETDKDKKRAAKRSQNCKLPEKELDPALEVGPDFLAKVDENKEYKIYEISEEFIGYDERHMPHMAKGQILVGLRDCGDWVFGIPDINPD